MSQVPPVVPPPVVAPVPIPWVVSKEDQARFEAMFIKADQDQDGYVNGPEIKHVFLSANLPQTTLANIWYVYLNNFRYLTNLCFYYYLVYY